MVGALETRAEFLRLAFILPLLVLTCSLSPNPSPQPGMARDAACKLEAGMRLVLEELA